MRVAEKRACLRATGVYELPRPREGPRAVDAMMIPLLDEEVAYEVLRRLAETKGDFAEAAEMEDFESKKVRHVVCVCVCVHTESELSSRMCRPSPPHLSPSWQKRSWRRGGRATRSWRRSCATR
jgi:hypothetical protein